MKTELLMTIDYIFTDEKKGKRIVGGAKPYYSATDLGWLNVIGKKVLIQTSKGEIYFKVIKADVFTSIAGAINIGLTLEADALFESICKGDQVFKIVEED